MIDYHAQIPVGGLGLALYYDPGYVVCVLTWFSPGYLCSNYTHGPVHAMKFFALSLLILMVCAGCHTQPTTPNTAPDEGWRLQSQIALFCFARLSCAGVSDPAIPPL